MDAASDRTALKISTAYFDRFPIFLFGFLLVLV
nr:MAG TPA: hypothetical protein [Caudoviricetes sp.]